MAHTNCSNEQFSGYTKLDAYILFFIWYLLSLDSNKINESLLDSSVPVPNIGSVRLSTPKSPLEALLTLM